LRAGHLNPEPPLQRAAEALVPSPDVALPPRAAGI